MMFGKRTLFLVRYVPRYFLTARRHLLSKEFALNEEWHARHSAFRDLGIEGSYEWITAVQKKFVSAGMASAVDVDAVVCTAEELDQLDDVLKIIYKFRHTEMTGEMLPSTEYALVRLLLKHHNIDTLLAVLADPINYGIFLNEHSACLLIDSFLEAGKIADAAQVASHVMLQEMFHSALLNWLCIYSALKWTELPSEQRNFEKIAELNFASDAEDDSKDVEDDEEEQIFKFPYLKNEYNDMHFDLTDPNQLIGKSLLWFADHVPVSDEERNSIRFLGSIFFGDYGSAKQLLQRTNICPSSIAVCRFKLEQGTTNTDSSELLTKQDSADLEELKAMMRKVEVNDKEEKISERIIEHLKAVQDTEEKKLMKIQRAIFLNWRQHRAELIKAQVEQLDLTLRLKEIREERQKLRDRWEVLNFFENRLKWEDMAAVKDELLNAEKGKTKSKEDLEQEYVGQMFLKENVERS